MSPRKRDEAGEQPEQPSETFKGSALKFVGRADYFVAGVPQSDLKVVVAPAANDEVTPDQATELVATGLYAEKPAEQGEGEMTNG